jgi:signal transduction histidine kinase
VDLRAVAEEAWVAGDADRILQIASNLVENALRETPAGGSVTVAADGASLVVSDTGPGIPAEDLPHAFERFYLYDKIGRDRLIGSGLGLAIVRQLATAMGGTVDVQSSAAGTTFRVDLRPHAGGVHDLEVGPMERTERV